MNNLQNKVTVKVTIKSQTDCCYPTFNRSNLTGKVIAKVTPKSWKMGLFCDFIVTNILVTPLIISTNDVTLGYIRRVVLLSQKLRLTSISYPMTATPNIQVGTEQV